MSYLYLIPGHAGEEDDVVVIDTGTHAIPVSSVVSYIADDSSKPVDEELIGELIDSVFGAFEEQTGNPIAQNEAYEWEFDDKRGQKATPGFVRVNAITKLEYRDALFNWVEIDASTYAEQRPNKVWQILYPRGFSYGTLYRATLNAGFATLPDQIATLIRNKVIEAYYDSVPSGRNRFGMDGEAVSGAAGTVTVKYDRKTLQAEWDKIVRKYSAVF